MFVSIAPYGLLLLPGTLKQYGYRAVAVTDGGNASRAFGFSGAFDDFDDQGGGALAGVRKLSRMIESGVKRGRPVFAWLQTYEVHPPWPADNEYEGMNPLAKPGDSPGLGRPLRRLENSPLAVP